jgi:PKD repeat protein
MIRITIRFVAVALMTAFMQPGLFAQGVKVSETNTPPHASSIFEVESSQKGFLPPRMTTAERDAMEAPIATGLQIYNTTTNCLNIFTGSSWKQLCPECEFDLPVVSSNSPVCAGSSVELSATALPGATYQWSGPGGFSSTEQNPEIPGASAMHEGVYSLVVTLSGCTSAPITTEVSVQSGPSVTPGSNSPLCEGSALQLTASSLPGATYSWTGPAGFESAEQNPLISAVTPAQGGLYFVTPTVNGCTGVASSLLVTVNAGGVSSFVYSPSNPIPGTQVTFTPTIAGNSYSWSFEDGTPISSSAENPSATWSTAGPHDVTLTASQNGCSTTTTVSLYVYTQVQFNYTGGEQTFTVPDGITSLAIDAFGAQGGTVTYAGTNYGAGGLGGKASGTLSVTPGETLRIYVGQQPSNYLGGFNGGGSSGFSTYGETRGGGGSSDIRQGGSALSNRVLVAGGGGSSATTSLNGGAGGGLDGGSTSNYTCCGGSLWTGAGGGTQLAGGSGGTGSSNGTAGTLGQGGNGGPVYGGGGGGGYYGGGGGSGSAQGMGYSTAGGGGSSYIGGVSNGSTTAGVNAGHGKVIVLY